MTYADTSNIGDGIQRSGREDTYDDSEIAVAVRNGLEPARTWGPDEWPCAFTAAAE